MIIFLVLYTAMTALTFEMLALGCKIHPEIKLSLLSRIVGSLLWPIYVPPSIAIALKKFWEGE